MEAHYGASKPSGSLLERIQLLEQCLPEDVRSRVVAKRKEIAQYRVDLLNTAAAMKPTESSSHTYSVDLKLYLAALTSLEQEAALYEDSCWAQDPRLFECHLRLLELDHLKQQYHNEVRAFNERCNTDPVAVNEKRAAQSNEVQVHDVPPEVTQQSFDKVASWDLSQAAAEPITGPSPLEETKSTCSFDDAFSAVPVSEYLAAARQVDSLKQQQQQLQHHQQHHQHHQQHSQHKVKLVHQGREVEVSPEVYKLYESLDISVLCELAKLMLVPSDKGEPTLNVATQKPYIVGSDPHKDKVLSYLRDLPDPVTNLFTGETSNSSNTKETQASPATSNNFSTPHATQSSSGPMKLVLRESKGSWRNKKYVWQLGETEAGGASADDTPAQSSWSTVIDKDGNAKVVMGSADSGAPMSKVKKLLRVVTAK